MQEKKELQYPVQYAVMPVEEQISYSPWLNELRPGCVVVANIVSKCYVIGERKEYSNGKTKIKYEVVFPYTKKEPYYYSKFEPTVPEYNLYSACTNSIFVDQLFSSFEEAFIAADQSNSKILYHEIGYLPFDENFKKNVEIIKSTYQEILNKYKKVEDTIKAKTNNMKITKPYGLTLENIIEKIVENPSDFYIKLTDQLSIQEREYLQTFIKDRTCNNCTNRNCRIGHCNNEELDELGQNQVNNCLDWMNPELVGRQFVLKKFNN